MGHQELPGDVAGPDAHEGQLYDPPPHVVGQRAAVDEDPAELVDSGLAWTFLLFPGPSRYTWYRFGPGGLGLTRTGTGWSRASDFNSPGPVCCVKKVS